MKLCILVKLVGCRNFLVLVNEVPFDFLAEPRANNIGQPLLAQMIDFAFDNNSIRGSLISEIAINIIVDIVFSNRNRPEDSTIVSSL